MRHISNRRVLALCLPCLLLALVVPALARYGRDFAGTYQVDNVSEDANVVHLTLTVKIFNNGDADIRNGAVALYDEQPRPRSLGGFPAIQIFKLHQEVTLKGQFDVPKIEYEHWKSGGQPNLFFLSRDHGMVLMRSIQVSRALQAPPQEQ